MAWGVSRDPHIDYQLDKGNYQNMEYQKAIAILTSLLDRHSLDAEEKEAVMTAIGLLSWASLSKSKIKALKAKRDKSTEW